MPNKVFKLQLGKATMVQLQDEAPGETDPDADEIYLAGAVEVFNTQTKDRLDNVPVKFSSPGYIIFKQADRGRPKQLQPSGEIYNQVLGDENSVRVTLLLVEGDRPLPADFTDALSRYIAKLSDLGQAVGVGEANLAADFLLSTLDFITSVNGDDVIGMHKRTFDLKDASFGADYGFSDFFDANMDNALYTPVWYKVDISDAP